MCHTKSLVSLDVYKVNIAQFVCHNAFMVMATTCFTAYMNLPRSAVTPRTPVDETSDYMNIEPNEPHIYQNTAILNIRKKPPSAVRSDAQLTVSHNSEPAEAVVHQEQQLEGRNASPSPHDESKSADCHDNHLAIPRESGADNSSHHDDTDSATHNQRREALADRSFVEKKYGLFTEEFFTPKVCDLLSPDGMMPRPQFNKSEIVLSYSTRTKATLTGCPETRDLKCRCLPLRALAL